MSGLPLTLTITGIVMMVVGFVGLWLDTRATGQRSEHTNP